MQHIRLEDLIVIDIETASTHAVYDDLDEEWKNLWKEKVMRTVPENISIGEYYPLRAGVMAEFSKIICISIGYFNKVESLHLRIKSFYGNDEKKLLTDFLTTINKIQAMDNRYFFAGHNIKEFDIPFICRRIFINGLQLPSFLDFQNKKPWETNMLDTFQYWRFGDFKNYTSLKLLAAAMGIPSPKDDIDGSMVGELYWSGNEEERKINLKRIVTYCQKDVITTANIILRFKNMPVIVPQGVDIID